MDKCPYCGSPNFGKVTPTKGTQYGFVEVNASTKQIFADTIKTVDIYGCVECKAIVLMDEGLKRN